MNRQKLLNSQFLKKQATLFNELVKVNKEMLGGSFDDDYHLNQALLPYHNGADHVYYNIVINNGYTDRALEANYTETRTGAILEKPSDYNISVIRFSISSANDIPVFIFKPVSGNLTTGNTCPNLGIYQVSMTYGSTVVTENLIYDTTNTFYSLPQDWTSITTTNWKYYAVYNYQFFIECINATLRSVYSQISILEADSPPVERDSFCPYLLFNPTTLNVSLIAPKSFSSAYVQEPTIGIWFNRPLYAFFDSSIQTDTFGSYDSPLTSKLSVYDRGDNSIYATPPAISYNLWQKQLSYVANQLISFNDINYICILANTNQPPPNATYWTAVDPTIYFPWNYTTAYMPDDKVEYNGSYYLCVEACTGVIPESNFPQPADPPNILYWVLDSSIECYQMINDYACLYRWNDLRNIVVISNGITSYAEFTPANTVSGNASNGVANSSLLILTDFVVDSLDGVDINGNINYLVDSEYRLADLQSDTPLRTVNLALYWQTGDGLTLPISLLPNGGNASVKLMFRRKDVI